MKRKKVMLALTACALASMVSLSGTMAYLASTSSKTNTFTLASGKTELEEPNWSEKAADHMVPCQTVAKDPKVTTTSTVPMLAFLEVKVPTKEFTHVAADGERQASSVDTIFYCMNAAGDGKDTYNSNWLELDSYYEDAAGKVGSTAVNGGYQVKVFGYTKAIVKNGDKNGETESLFNYTQLKNMLEGELTGTTQAIQVTQYSIQAEYLTNPKTNKTITPANGVYGKDDLKEALSMAKKDAVKN